MYSFQLISSPVAMSLFQWFLLPSTLFWVCFWQYNVQNVRTQVNGTITNVTIRETSVQNVAFFSGMTLEALSILLSPLLSGRILNGQKKIVGGECCINFPDYGWMIVLAITSQLTCYAMFIFPMAIRLVKSSKTKLLFVLPFAIHWANYLLLRSSALLLAGCLMDKVAQKCTTANRARINAEAKSCLKAHQQLSSSLGPLLLVFVSIDSLYLTVYSFMIYMTWTYSAYTTMFNYIFMCFNAGLALIYICISCDKYLNSMEVLLEPLRYSKCL